MEPEQIHDRQFVHQEAETRGSFLFPDAEQPLARMTYSRANATLVIIDHTEVDPSLKGQGVGRLLLNAAVSWARETGTRIIALCPFAAAQFASDPSIRDVLA